MTLEETVKQLVADSLHRNESEVTLEADFINDLQADSLDTAELVMAIEDKFKQFGIEQIAENEAEKFKTVGDVVAYLKEKGAPENLD
jgi:acyl carrier protein